MSSFSLIRPYFIAHRRVLGLGLICLIFVDLLQLLIPRIVKHAVDGLAAGGMDTAGLASHGLAIAGLAAGIGLFRYGWRYYLIGTSRKIERGLRNQLFSQLITQDAPYFDRTRTGDLMSHATNDIANVRMAAGMGIVAVTDALLLGGAAVGFMAWIHPELALLSVLPMPFIAVITRVFGRKMHHRYSKVQEGLSDMTEEVREAFSGIRVLKVFGMGEMADERLEKRSKAYLAQKMRLVRVTGSLMPLMLFLANTALAILVALGGKMVIQGRISPGDFVAFISYLGILTWPMMALGWMTNLIQRGKASLDRLAMVMGEDPAVKEPENPVPLSGVKGEILVKDLSFCFTNKGPDVLSDIGFTIAPGSRIGITGPPGSGKTSLLSLLARLYDPGSGTIFLDGVDLKTIGFSDLRNAVQMLPQEPWLFSGSLRENIAGFDGDVCEEDLMAACRKAALTETIAMLSDGLDTVVGEKGVMLSGGQKQRAALARTLLSPAPVLLLDDPVSQVDTATADQILSAIRDIRGTTVVLASHRFSAIWDCDQIFVMEKGRIRAVGNHARLVETDAYYARTWQLQSIAANMGEVTDADS